MSALDRLLPKQVDNEYRGSWVAAWFFLLVTVSGVVRSCIHLLAPDGGGLAVLRAWICREQGVKASSLPSLYGAVRSCSLRWFSSSFTCGIGV